MSAPVTYEVAGDVAVVRMDDGKANALGAAMLVGLEAALERAAQEQRAVVLAGREGRFSAGFDLKVMMTSREAARELVGRGAEFFIRLFAYPRPVVAACTGHAMAGGALLLLGCDTRIGATGDFKVGLNEVAIGMTLPAFAMELARARLAPTALTAATIQGRIYTPSEAVPVGYLDHVVDGAAVLGRTLEEATRLAALPAAAYAGTKAGLREGDLATLRSALARDLATL